ncbi:MAG: histidine phosphatase family protein [Planctomycetota bacterium]|jgi:broad specificity phosphatase PhoE
MVHEAVRLRLVRHGEVAVPHRATFYGQRDVPLSPEGHRASLALAPRLAADAPDLVLSSPLQRARLLAEAVAASCGAPLEIEPSFQELDRGAWAGRKKVDIEAEAPGSFAAYMADPEGSAAPGGEKDSELCARVWTALTPHLVAHGGGRLLLVAHAHVIRVIMARVACWSPAESLRHFVPPHGVADLEVAADGTGVVIAAPEPLSQDAILRG